ncbi:LEA type 2 family protein [Lysobacter cavernae]|uniref:LEA type 2 family protein n=1 Tax=Lysobacter cavernae TaxID=1685901 RepID=A0ABV7RMR1_9GAMM
MKAKRWMRWTGLALCVLLLAACSTGPVRRVSEPSARIQQLTVRADGSWSAELRIENFSSIPMRFDSLDLALRLGDDAAGQLQAKPALSIGPESADIITVVVKPQAAAKLAVAEALAAGRGVSYTLEGHIDATPDQGKLRSFDIKRSSALSPAPGLPGVLR